jgi:serpin B
MLAASDQVWADPALRTLPSYLNAVTTGYGAGVSKVPLLTDPQLAADQINQVIGRDTRGQITRLVNPGMLAGIGWVLTSALSMNAAWATPFEPGQTRPGPFTPLGGKPVTVQYMNGSGYQYATSGGWTGVSLPYQGGQLAMLALLPPAGSGNCALPAAPALAAIAAGASASRAATSAQAIISMPRVAISSSASVNDELKALGMGLAFTGSADFTGLSPQAGMIGFVQQAATLKVGERGTVAAAAAADGGTATSGMVGQQLNFNRPYLLLVTDTTTGEPLFLARVVNPALG